MPSPTTGQRALAPLVRVAAQAATIPAFWKRFYARQLLLLAVSGVMLAVVFHFSALDARLAQPWYEPLTASWPLRHAWWAEVFFHQWVRRGLMVAALVCIAVAWRRRHATDAARWRVVGASALVVPALITFGKRASSMHCPWDVAGFGGAAPYFDVFAAVPPHLANIGHCFPAGFVSSASWMLAFALLRYPEDRAGSLRAGALALAAALALGVLQQMRGAHFFSHTLWSIWISWSVVLVLHLLLGAWKQPGADRVPDGTQD